MANEPQTDAIFTKYLQESKALILDSNSGSRTRMVAALVQLGAKRQNILSTGSYEEAQASIPVHKPKIVLTDFMIGAKSGLDLLQEQRQAHKDLKSCVFILVTGNTSQSAVARAAEEDVDTYILKPYTLESFRKSLMTAVNTKINPSEYLKTIESGKDLLFEAKLDDAIPYFEKAMGMSPQPTLACFYLGQVDMMREAIDKASESYDKGLGYNRIHYKCLIGLFDILSKQKRYPEAYDVVKKVAQYFPANPKRLASVLRLAIMTNNYDDIESYYRVFVQLDTRTDELTNYMCSALVVTGKHYLLSRVNRRAIEIFDKAIVSSAGKTRFIRYAIENLTEFNLTADAEALLKRFPGDSREGEDYEVSNFLVMGRVSQSGKVLQKGRDLIKRGVQTPAIYKVMIEHSAKTSQKDSMDELLAHALKAWPSQAKDFNSIADFYTREALAESS